MIFNESTIECSNFFSVIMTSISIIFYYLNIPIYFWEHFCLKCVLVMSFAKIKATWFDMHVIYLTSNDCYHPPLQGSKCIPLMHCPESPLHVQHQCTQDAGSDGAHCEMVFVCLDCGGPSEPGS